MAAIAMTLRQDDDDDEVVDGIKADNLRGKRYH
jgi:hypothetical protein